MSSFMLGKYSRHAKRMINNTAFWNVDWQCYNLVEIYRHLEEPAAFYQAT